MEFGLSEEQQQFREAARAFAEGELAPNAAAWDEDSVFPVETLRAGRRARLRRALCRRGCGGLGLPAARRGDRAGGARRRLHLDGGLCLDPQHGRLDDRRLRERGPAPRVAAEAQFDGVVRELLPDRARQRVGRGLADHKGRARRRGLRAQRRQGVHLGRRERRPLRHHGAHRGRGAGRDHLHRRRGRHAGALLRRAGEEARLALPAHRHGLFRRLPGAGRQPHRRRGGGVPHRHGGARRRADQYRRVLDRRRPGVLRGGAGLCRRAPAVRPRHRRLPGDPVQARRHGDRARIGEAHGVARGGGDRRGRGGRDAPLCDGQAPRHRCRVRGLQRGPATAWRVRLSSRPRDRALSARPEGSPDPRRDHEIMRVIIARRLLAEAR